MENLLYAEYSIFTNHEYAEGEMTMQRQVALKPQDVVVALKISLSPMGARITYAALSGQLALSASDLHLSAKRLKVAGLIASNGDQLSAVRPSLAEFLVYGVKYAFPATYGPIAQGMPTAGAGPTLRRLLMANTEEQFVWPHQSGSGRGPSLLPLYPNAPLAAQQDDELYNVLTCLDALRVGGAREREISVSEIRRALL